MLNEPAEPEKNETGLEKAEPEKNGTAPEKNGAKSDKKAV